MIASDSVWKKDFKCSLNSNITSYSDLIMDSKQLFRLYRSKYSSISWLNADGELARNEADVDWVYCGVNEDYRNNVVCEAISNTFDDDVYLCISANNSSLVSKSIAVTEIGKFLHKKDIGVADQSFAKIIEFTKYGVFKIGIIREFQQSRNRKDGVPLNVLFNANIVDNSTLEIAKIVQNSLRCLEKELSNDYGGSLEHLWIDLELVERHLSNRDVWAFRFQKRVSNPISYTEFYTYNVGHYSVKPDFSKLKEFFTEESICSYILGLIYASTQILVDKQTKLGAFDVAAFRRDFVSACQKMGYNLF